MTEDQLAERRARRRVESGEDIDFSYTEDDRRRALMRWSKEELVEAVVDLQDLANGRDGAA